MASNTNRKRSKEHESVLEKAMKRFNDSWKYQEDNWHKLWQRDNKLYNNERVYAQYHGVTDTFVPMTFSTIETMVAAMNNANLRFDFDSNDPLRQTSTAPLNSLFDEWWDKDQWDLLFEEDEREMLITGMAGNMVSWELDHPHIEHYAMLDMIVDPTIRHPYQLQEPGSYAGRRYLVRKGSLEDFEVVDTDEKSPTYGEMVKRFKLPRNAGSISSADGEDDKTQKERTAGSTLATASEDQDEIIELWDVDRVVTILNRKDVIEDAENPHKARHRVVLTRQYIKDGLEPEEAQQRAYDECQGLVPYFFFRNYRRTSLLYAKSEIDAIAKPQELLNDFTNMEADAVIKALGRQRWLDPKHADFIDLITDEPDVTNLLPENAMGFYDAPRVDGNAFNNRMNLKNEIRETTAIDQLAKGIANVRPTTATEVNAQSANTTERIESKARILEKDGLFWMAHILFRMFQLYVDQPLVVEVKGKDADGLKTEITLPDGSVRQLPPGTALLDPADYQGDWRPKVTLEIDAKSKKAEEQAQARETFQMMIQDPTNNLPELKRRMYPKMTDLNKDDIEAIITADPNQPGVDPATGMPLPGAALPPEGVDPAAAGQLPPELPVEAPAPESVPEDVDADALQQFLTPDEWAQLQAALAEAQV